MNFSGAKKLIPSPAVLVVLAIIAAAFVVYIIAVKQATAQLNQRNFYYLSVTERNLEASLAAVSTISKTVQHFMYLLPGEFKERCKQKPANSDTKLCDPSTKVAEIYREIMYGRLSGTNKLFTKKDQISVSPVYPRSRLAYYAEAHEERQSVFSTSGIVVAWNEEVKVKGDVDAETHFLDVKIEVPYANIRGIKDHPNYFQSVIIFGAESNRVYADTSDLPSRNSQDSIAHGLPSARAQSAEKLSSLEVVKALYTIQLKHKLSRSADDSASPSLPDIAFTQSDIVKFEMGDNTYLAFIQPTDLTIENEPMVLLGLVPESDYQVSKYSIDLLTFTYISLVLIGLSALIPIVRLYLFHSEAILRPGDWVQLAIAVPFIATVVLVLINTVLAQVDFESSFDKQLKHIASNMGDEFKRETEDKFARLYSLSENVKQDDYKGGAHPGRYREDEKSCSAMWLIERNREECKLADQYRGSCDLLFTGVFAVDGSGKRTGECFTALLYPTFKVDDQVSATRTDLSQRAYVKGILQSSGFYKYADNGRPRGYFERVESIIDGVLETVFSIQHPLHIGSRAENERSKTDDSGAKTTSVAVGLSTMQSFESAILPFGFQYAVIDKVSGDVIFHSEDAKALRENYFQAVDHDGDLLAAVLSDTNGLFDANYNGASVRAFLQALEQTPWTLVVFYDREIVQAQLFHFATAGISMLVIYVLVLFLFILIVILLALGIRKIFGAIAPTSFEEYYFGSIATTGNSNVAPSRSVFEIMPFRLLFNDVGKARSHPEDEKGAKRAVDSPGQSLSRGSLPPDATVESPAGETPGAASTASRLPERSRRLQAALAVSLFLSLFAAILWLHDTEQVVYLVLFLSLACVVFAALLLSALLASRQERVTSQRYRREKYIGQNINGHIKEKGRLLTIAMILMGLAFLVNAYLKSTGSVGSQVSIYLLGFFVAYWLFKIVLCITKPDFESANTVLASPVFRLSIDAGVFFLLCVASYHANTTSDIFLVLAFSILYGASKLLEFTVDTTQREPQVDRNRGLYELAERGSVVVVFLFLIPFSLLLNENFDLHERSWVNFNNWRDTHTVRDKYVESRNSQRRYFKKEEAKQMASFQPFSLWVGSHSRYFYFPGTFIAECSKENGGDSTSKNLITKSFSRTAARQDDVAQPEIDDMRLMALIDTSEMSSHCHYTGISVQSAQTNNAKYFAGDGPEYHGKPSVDKEHYLSELLYFIPHFSNIGAVLLQSSGKSNAWLKEWTQCKAGSDFLCTVIDFPGIDAAFAITQYYPHTRTPDNTGFYIYLSVLLLLSFLVLVLMRISLPVLVPNLTFQCPREIGKEEQAYLRPLYVSKQREIVMANLAYFGLANPRNTIALDSLLAEGKIRERRMGYEIADATEIRKAKSALEKSAMIKVARREGQGAWRHVRAPLMLLMLGAVLFAIYAAQDELSSILQIFGSIAALLVTAKSVVGSFKNNGE